MCLWTLHPGPLVTVQLYRARRSLECRAPLHSIGIRLPDGTEGCELPATVYAHAASHQVSSVPLEIIGDKDMLRGRLVGAQKLWMGLMHFPKLSGSSSERQPRMQDQASPFFDVCPSDTIQDFGICASFL